MTYSPSFLNFYLNLCFRFFLVQLLLTGKILSTDLGVVSEILRPSCVFSVLVRHIVCNTHTHTEQNRSIHIFLRRLTVASPVEVASIFPDCHCTEFKPP